jgi:hypothetical protein
MLLPTPRESPRPTLRLALAVFSPLLALPFCAAQTPPSTPAQAQALISRAVANRFAENSTHRPLRFVLNKQDERHNLTQEIVETPQGDVALLVGVNGSPLGPAGRQAERNRLDLLNGHPEVQQHRQRREQADADRVDNLLRMLPDAFLYAYEDTVPCTVTTPPQVRVPGAPSPAPAAPARPEPCWHMTFTPNPKWNPPNIEARVLTGMAGEIWIEAPDDRLYKLNAHLIEDVDFGWGIVGRLDKGGTVYLEQTLIGDRDWELTRMKLNLTGKALMVKPLSYRINEELSDFVPVPPGTDYHKAIGILEAEQPAAK